jgi:hypothetical protein
VASRLRAASNHAGGCFNGTFNIGRLLTSFSLTGCGQHTLTIVPGDLRDVIDPPVNALAVKPDALHDPRMLTRGGPPIALLDASRIGGTLRWMKLAEDHFEHQAEDLPDPPRRLEPAATGDRSLAAGGFRNRA